jgi:predicted metal-dependent hydrolase
MLFEDQSKTHPETAFELLKTTEKELLFKARNLIKQYYTLTNAPESSKKLAETINISFEPTQVMDNVENIAEYDHPKRTIRLQPKMMFASPNVVAAYLAHELIHAEDQDGETSIQEEQDGYRELVNFWQRFKNAESEPNLDRTLKLYEESPTKLDEEVKRLYTMRNPLIAEKSPKHGLNASTQPLQILNNIQQRYSQYLAERVKKWLGFYQPSAVGEPQFLR